MANPLTGVSLALNANVTSKNSANFLTNQTQGIYVTSVKFEADSSPEAYLTPNGTGLVYKIFIKGSTSGSAELYSITINNSGIGVHNIGTRTANVTLKGNIYLQITLSGKTAYQTGFVNGTVKVTITYTPTVTLIYPAAASKTTYNSKPYFKMSATGANAMTYQYKIDNGSWTNVATSVSSGTAKEWRAGSAVSAASHTLYVRATDTTASLTSTEVSRTFTYAVPSTVTVGDYVTSDDSVSIPNMKTLKTYIDNLSAYYGTGSSTTITAPAKGAPLKSTDWTNYVAKINATPHISDLAVPGVGTKVLASYYNGYITKLQSG